MLEIDHCMEQIAVTAEICVVITSQPDGKTVGDCKMVRRPVHVASVQGIYGVLEMKHVGCSVVRTGFVEYLADKSVAFFIPSGFGKKLCLLNHKLELLVAPVVAAGIVDKFVKNI